MSKISGFQKEKNSVQDTLVFYASVSAISWIITGAAFGIGDYYLFFIGLVPSLILMILFLRRVFTVLDAAYGMMDSLAVKHPAPSDGTVKHPLVDMIDRNEEQTRDFDAELDEIDRKNRKLPQHAQELMHNAYTYDRELLNKALNEAAPTKTRRSRQ